MYAVYFTDIIGFHVNECSIEHIYETLPVKLIIPKLTKLIQVGKMNVFPSLEVES